MKFGQIQIEFNLVKVVVRFNEKVREKERQRKFHLEA